MIELESFYFDLYYAKLKWMSFQSGYIQPLWSDATQNQINALSNIAPVRCDLEAHVIACQTFFAIETEAIIEAMRNCLKSTTENMIKDQFTMCVFNRLTLNKKK
jgi:hypothetical protein